MSLPNSPWPARSFADRFRVVVAMWIFVGFGGTLLFGSFGLMAVTATGPFADKSTFAPALEFKPGVEVATSGEVRPGGLMVLAYPATVDLGTVECTSKSRVYSTGKQNIETMPVARTDGVAETLTTSEPAPRTFVPVTATEGIGWMEVDFVSCTGQGVESFAVTSTKGVKTDGFRYGVGALLLVLTPVVFGFGMLALHFTRKWMRQGAVAPVPYALAPHHGPAPQAMPPGYNPYAPKG
jgi:hypothetical protein